MAARAYPTKPHSCEVHSFALSRSAVPPTTTGEEQREEGVQGSRGLIQDDAMVLTSGRLGRRSSGRSRCSSRSPTEEFVVLLLPAPAAVPPPMHASRRRKCNSLCGSRQRSNRRCKIPALTREALDSRTLRCRAKQRARQVALAQTSILKLCERKREPLQKARSRVAFLPCLASCLATDIAQSDSNLQCCKQTATASAAPPPPPTQAYQHRNKCPARNARGHIQNAMKSPTSLPGLVRQHRLENLRCVHMARAREYG